jgi:hypothetical protein
MPSDPIGASACNLEIALTDALREAERLRLKYKRALREIVRREARSEYSSIYAAPSEFARVAREALDA